MDYEGFKRQVYDITTINLDAYKERQMKRRIDALIQKNNCQSYDEYVHAIRTNPDLLEQFVNYLTINVSEFYRNPDQWRILETDLLPDLIREKGPKLKVWSAACSTGDEPYTLAMVIGKMVGLQNVRIYATDIDRQVLEKAKLGLYNEKSLAGLPEEYKSKYFTKVGLSSYQISEDIKRCVEFKQHDLLKDAYPQDCDLIVCRNVLIYFTEEAKTEIYAKFSKSMRKGSILFIGSTEQIIHYRDIEFETYKSFFYRKAN